MDIEKTRVELSGTLDSCNDNECKDIIKKAKATQEVVIMEKGFP
jgi:hypothetical protein